MKRKNLQDVENPERENEQPQSASLPLDTEKLVAVTPPFQLNKLTQNEFEQQFKLFNDNEGHRLHKMEQNY